jgi:hypothetical protein
MSSHIGRLWDEAVRRPLEGVASVDFGAPAPAMYTRKKRFPNYYSMSTHNNGKSFANDMKVTCNAQPPVSIRVPSGFTQDRPRSSCTLL